MAKVEFLKKYQTRKKGEVWDNCPQQLASRLVRKKIVKIVEGGNTEAKTLKALRNELSKTETALEEAQTVNEALAKENEELKAQLEAANDGGEGGEK